MPKIRQLTDTRWNGRLKLLGSRVDAKPIEEELAMRIATALVTCALIMVAAEGLAMEPNALARRVLQAVDRPVGLVHLPRCGHGSLAVALVGTNKDLRVHGQVAEAADVAAAREAADEAGLLNQRVWIDQGGLDRLLPIARSADLIVLIDLTTDELTPRLAAEIQRVLHPWCGMAVLGDVSGELNRKNLTDWAKQIASNVSSLQGEGTLVTVRAEPLEGADNWTHWWHGPDNNAVSSDTAYHVPETIQWTGKPYFSTRLELPIVSNGRLFMLWNGHLLDATPGEPILPGEEVVLKTHGWATVLDGPLNEQRGPLLSAQAVGSGVRLWHRRLSPAAWLQAARSTIVADGDSLLVADGASLLELDQATGDMLRRVETDCGEIRWMAVTEGCVLLLGGPRFPSQERRSPENVIPFRSSGLKLTVLDRKTLVKLWQQDREEGLDAFDPRSPAACDGTLLICTEGGEAEAYRIKDGTLQWRTDTGIERLKPRGFEWDRSTRHAVTGYAVAGLYVISGPETDRCAVLSQKDGKLVWDLPRGQGPVGPIPLALWDLVWVDGNGLDPATGEIQRQVNLDRGGCSRFTAAPQGFFGTEGLTWNTVLGKEHPVIPAKSGCAAGQYAANGLAWKFPTPCSGCMEWRGFLVRGPAEEDLPSPGPRLMADAELTRPSSETVGWTTYRANAQRSMSTTARLGRRPEIAWHTPPGRSTGSVSNSDAVLFGSEIVPTPPVIAGDTVFVGSADGTVEAIDLETGSRRWRALTGGRIYSSPAIWKDRVFVGCADGFVYAYGLADGRSLWRLRVAKQTGRMMLYGQLGSRWPVLGSPLVVRDRVYAVAGLLNMLDGVCAVAADATSGQIVWERTTWDDAEVEHLISGRCLAGTGQLCWDDRVGEVVFSGGDAPPVRLSPVDGACRVAYARGRVKDLSTGWPRNWQTLKGFRGTYSNARGQDVGSLGPGWMVFGGRRLLIDQTESGTWRMNLHFLAQDENGDGCLPVLRASDCVLTPSWDDADILFMLQDRRSATIALLSRSKLFATLRRKRGQVQFAGTARRVLRTNWTCPLFRTRSGSCARSR